MRISVASAVPKLLQDSNSQMDRPDQAPCRAKAKRLPISSNACSRQQTRSRPWLAVVGQWSATYDIDAGAHGSAVGRLRSSSEYRWDSLHSDEVENSLACRKQLAYLFVVDSGPKTVLSGSAATRDGPPRSWSSSCCCPGRAAFSAPASHCSTTGDGTSHLPSAGAPNRRALTQPVDAKPRTRSLRRPEPPRLDGAERHDPRLEVRYGPNAGAAFASNQNTLVSPASRWGPGIRT